MQISKWYVLHILSRPLLDSIMLPICSFPSYQMQASHQPSGLCMLKQRVTAWHHLPRKVIFVYQLFFVCSQDTAPLQ